MAAVRGFIGHTDHGWWKSLSARSDLTEVNFWRPGGRRFIALSPGEPFFFRLKSPINRIGGFGLFARDARLPRVAGVGGVWCSERSER
jgi:putative restriction endonuclease